MQNRNDIRVAKGGCWLEESAINFTEFTIEIKGEFASGGNNWSSRGCDHSGVT